MRTFDRLFREGTDLEAKGKYREAAQIFLNLSAIAENGMLKINSLIHATHALKETGQLKAARDLLEKTRSFLSIVSDGQLDGAEKEYIHGLEINLDLEAARITAGEGNAQGAVAELELLLAKHRSNLQIPSFAEIYRMVRRERACLLADLGRFEDALTELEDLNSNAPRDSWILFNLGYCYRCMERYSDAQLKLEEAIKIGLTRDFEGRAHCILGAASYELGEYVRAKSELEVGVRMAAPHYIRGSRIWRLLEYTCVSLGLKDKADFYASLDKGSSQPS